MQTKGRNLIRVGDIVVDGKERHELWENAETTEFYVMGDGGVPVSYPAWEVAEHCRQDEIEFDDRQLELTIQEDLGISQQSQTPYLYGPPPVLDLDQSARLYGPPPVFDGDDGQQGAQEENPQEEQPQDEKRRTPYAHLVAALLGILAGIGASVIILKILGF